MPTVADDWHVKKEMQDAIIDSYINAAPTSIDASESVLMARLSGLGMRGDYLASEVRQAMARRHDSLTRRPA